MTRVTYQVLYPWKLGDRLLDGRLEVAILEVQRVLPAAYFRRRVRLFQHLRKNYRHRAARVPDRYRTGTHERAIYATPRFFSDYFRSS